MSDTDEAEVTLRLTASERRAVVAALLRRASRLRRLERSCLRQSDRADAAQTLRDIRRVLARITEGGE